MVDVAWICANRNGHLLIGTIAARRVDAIKRMVGPEPDYKNRWRWWKRNHGVTCQTVRLVRVVGEK